MRDLLTHFICLSFVPLKLDLLLRLQFDQRIDHHFHFSAHLGPERKLVEARVIIYAHLKRLRILLLLESCKLLHVPRQLGSLKSALLGGTAVVELHIGILLKPLLKIFE